MPTLDFERGRWSWLTLLTALVTGVVLSFLPISSTASCEAVAGGTETCTTGSESLLQSEGLSVLAVLAVPVFVAAVAVVFPRRGAAVTSAVLLTVLTLLGAASLGLFYLPTTDPGLGRGRSECEPAKGDRQPSLTALGVLVRGPCSRYWIYAG